MPVLDEVRDEVGTLLFRSLRNVLIWAQLPHDERPAAFSANAAQARIEEMRGANVPPELLAPLSVITELLAEPGEVDTARLALACRRIALWAEDRGALGTALDFSQAAALVRPETAMLAFAVGRLARQRAQYDRAESWFARAIIQGRQSGDWRAYATAFSGLGVLNQNRGNYPAAERAHRRCLRAALRHGLRDLEAIAYHDLSVAAYHRGAHAEANEFAGHALAAYGARPQQVARLAYDVAYNWVMQGQFENALAVAEALLGRFDSPAQRLQVHGLVARAAGGAGSVPGFESSSAEVWRLVREGVGPEGASGAVLGVSYGAASLGRWHEAEEAAARAIEISRTRSEGDMVLIAEALLDAARRRRRTVQRDEAPAPRGAALAAELRAALGRPALAPA
jgi:tetratricopeptide (TPR) repeat protein